MKTLIPAAIAVACLSPGLDAQEARPGDDPEPRNVVTYFGPGSSPGYRVTMRSASGVLSVLEVPDGVFLSVSGEAGPDDPDRWTYLGTVTIRTRRADEVDLEMTHLAHEIMDGAPLEITLENATVIVETSRER